MLETHYAQLIKAIGDTGHEETLSQTPRCAAEAMRFFTSGYQQSLADIVTDGIFPCDNTAAITLKNIEFYSLCEHHLLPFFGVCEVTYVPNGNILGLSKIAKIVDLYARRLQLQERLTQQIAEGVHTAVNATKVQVRIEAQHLCMMMRGVQKQQAVVITNASCE